MPRGRKTNDELLTPEELAKRVRIRANAARSREVRKAKELEAASQPGRIRLPGNTHKPARYSYVVWIHGVSHQTEDVLFNRVLVKTRSLLYLLVKQGAITEQEMEVRMDQARELIRSIEERERVDASEDDSLVYPHDPRHVLLEFIPEDERRIDEPPDAPVLKYADNPAEYHRQWRRRRKQLIA